MDYRSNNLLDFLNNRNVGGDPLCGASTTRNAASVLSSYGSDGISEVLESSFLNKVYINLCIYCVIVSLYVHITIHLYLYI